MSSVIVPAHEEEGVIARCLDSLLAQSGLAGGRRTIHVVANGCTDRTVEVARRYGDRGVLVHETATASKIAALAEGDRVAGDDYPRAYVDADVVLGPGALDAVEEALNSPGVLACAPRLRVALQGRPRAVRWFYDDFLDNPWVTQGLLGSGFYAMSREGRGRFGAWPQVLNDDGFVHHLFAPDERRTVDAWFEIQAPHTLDALVAAKARVAVGNDELDRLRRDGVLPPSRHVVQPGGLRRVLRRWVVRPHIMGTVALIRRRIRVEKQRRVAGAEGATWGQDRTTR